MNPFQGLTNSHCIMTISGELNRSQRQRELPAVSFTTSETNNSPRGDKHVNSFEAEDTQREVKPGEYHKLILTQQFSQLSLTG